MAEQKKQDIKIRGDILIVDDEALFLSILEKMFKKLYNVQTAESGEDALKILESGFQPGVILSDQKMPGMSGSEFLKESINIAPEATRVIITGYSDPKDIIRCINEAHAYMFITKPSSNLELFQSVNVAFDHYYRKRIKMGSGASDAETGNLLRENSTLKSQIVKLKSEKEKLNTDIDGFDKKIDTLQTKLDENQDKQNSLENDLASKKSELAEARENISTQKKKIDEMSGMIEKLDKFPKQLVPSLSNFIAKNEIYYFKPHTESVVNICDFIADYLGLSPQYKAILHSSAKLHSLTTLTMPDYLQVSDPYELDDKLKYYFFKQFKENLNLFNGVDYFQLYFDAIGQMWEHHDGSGFPNNLKGDEISKPAQILSIAHIYHKTVYGLTPEMLEEARKGNKLEQSKATTQHRHKDAVKYFYRRGSWYDIDIIRTFQDIIKDKECPELVPSKDNFELDLSKQFLLPVGGKSKNKGDEYVGGSTVDDEIDMVDKVIDVSELKTGMLVAQDIVTKNGIMVVKRGTKLSAEIVKNIHHLEGSGMISGEVVISVPDF